MVSHGPSRGFFSDQKSQWCESPFFKKKKGKAIYRLQRGIEVIGKKVTYSLLYRSA